MEQKLYDIEFENLKLDGSNADKIRPIPKAIIDYYKENGYMDKMIPLNAKTCKEIAEILDNGKGNI